MPNAISSFLLLLTLMFGAETPTALPAASPRKVVIAYIFPQERVLLPKDIAAGQLTRINYAFANIKRGRMVEGFPLDAENLRTLVGLKRYFPELQVLVSVGGWSWSGAFSDVALTPESRANFIDSAVDFIREHSLDGIDIDWEYPGLPGAGNKHRSEDKQNFTALLKELRARLNREANRLGCPLLTSIAAGASEEYAANVELAQVQRYVNTINLMTYDYYTPSGDHTTGHHAPLHASPADPRHASAAGSVELFESMGVPASKLVLGLPFYGHAWKHVDDVQHGLFQRGKKSDLEPDYKAIAGLLATHEYIRYWDPTACVPYLYSSTDRTFITYEDPQSIQIKCRYVMEHHLAGAMFWEYTQDAHGELLHAITAVFRSQTSDGAKRY